MGKINCPVLTRYLMRHSATGEWVLNRGKFGWPFKTKHSKGQRVLHYFEMRFTNTLHILVA